MAVRLVLRRLADCAVLLGGSFQIDLYSPGVSTLNRKILSCSSRESTCSTAPRTREIRSAGRKSFQAVVTTRTIFIPPKSESSTLTFNVLPLGSTRFTAPAIFWGGILIGFVFVAVMVLALARIVKTLATRCKAGAPRRAYKTSYDSVIQGPIVPASALKRSYILVSVLRSGERPAASTRASQEWISYSAGKYVSSFRSQYAYLRWHSMA